MTRSATLLTVCLLVLGAFVFAAPKASAQGAAPVWSIGDYWEYTGSGEISGQRYDMLMRYEVKERTTISIGSTPYDTFYMAMKVDMKAGRMSSSMTYDYWVQTSDLANVKLKMEVLSLQMNITFNPPQQAYNFPLSNGKTWSSTTTMTMTGMGMPPSSTTVTTSFRVSGPERIKVHAGTFDSFNVTGTSSGTSSSAFYSDTVGYIVKTSSYSIPGLGSSGMSAMELKSYNYQHGSGLVWVVLIVVIVIAVVVAVAVAMFVMARRAQRMLPPMQPQGPPLPPQTPPSPPQAPPSPPQV